MKNKHIIKKNFEFQEIINLQQKIMNNSYVVYSRANKQPHLRYGISVGRKLAKSHVRNHIKRQVRVIIYDFLKQQEIANRDIIVIIRPSYLKNDFKTNKELLNQLLNKLVKRYTHKSIVN